MLPLFDELDMCVCWFNTIHVCNYILLPTYHQMGCFEKSSSNSQRTDVYFFPQSFCNKIRDGKYESQTVHLFASR